MLYSKNLPLGLLLAAAAIPHVAYSQVFLSEADSLKVLFPGRAFTKKNFTLTADEIASIEKKSGQKVRSKTFSAFVSGAKDTVFVDEVLGKHEFITYAVGVKNDGHVKGIEILTYRETYGQQVHGEGWRKQFVDKTANSPLRVDDDIKNISGATLSSTHVIAGVKRILLTYEVVRHRTVDSFE